MPYISHTSPRSNNELAQRTLIVLAFFNIYLGATYEAIHAWLDEHHLLPYLSAEENLLLNQLKENSKIEEKENNLLGWYVESLWALMWVGSHIDSLDPEMHVSNNLVELVPNIEKNESGHLLMSKTKIRPYREIYRMLDLYYRVHWFARDGYWSGYQTGNFDLGIIQSRRQSLEWIIDKTADWDEVDLST